jgi:hypothetical protein
LSKKLTEVFDKIGQPIKVGSIVAAPCSASMITINRVEKITPKQLRLSNTSYKYHHEVICLDEMEATVMYLMTRNL